MTAIERLAGFAAGVSLDALPREAVDKAKLCILDALSGCLAPESSAEGRASLALARARAGAPRATVFGSDVRTSTSDAAFVNAVTASGTSRTDTHAASATHPGPVIVPVALAMAEAASADGRTVIESVVAGYEIMSRLGMALLTPEFAAIHRPTGKVAPTAAAFTAGRVARMETGRLAAAGSLATHCASGLNEWTYAGTPELPFHSGFAARNGVDCALLADAGAMAAPSILEGRAGLLAGYGASDRVAALTEGLGERWRIVEVDHKPAPVCVYAQTPVQVAKRLLATCGDPVAIRSIAVHVSRSAAMYPGCDDAGPIRDAQAAKLSIQFAVGSVFARCGVSDENWRDYTHRESNAMAARCTVRVDETFTAAPPGRQGARIDVTLASGDVVSAEQDRFEPMRASDVAQRFERIATERLDADRATRIVALVLSLENAPDVSHLSRLLYSAGTGGSRNGR